MEILHLDQITPDAVILWKWKFLVLNATILYTWILMALITVGSWLVTRDLSTETASSRWQCFLEVVVTGIRDQIREISQQDPHQFLPFIGTLFVFIGVSNFLSFVPGYSPPTSSLSTTTALAICVFIAVPLYGIWDRGLIGYLKHYAEPSLFMVPLHIMSEISRTLALAIRLFGNVMSGNKVVAILLAISPFVFPIVINMLELLIGLIQAYIFAVLATVFISAVVRAQHEKEEDIDSSNRLTGSNGLNG
jgi:F-type H+-transporting ATPase subunit a